MGISKKREEFNEMKNILDERQRDLENLESELNKNKKILNKDRNEYVEWRKKLELLEDDIELRREYVVYNEEKIDEKLKSLKKLEGKIETTPNKNQKNHDYGNEDLIGDLPSPAAVIQRGIIKKANDKFVELLGYQSEVILEKNVTDFIVPRGFSGIENYYLKRLKGEDVSTYETIFLTKNDIEIPVDVKTEQVFYNGEKAEVAVFKKSNNIKNQNIVSSA